MQYITYRQALEKMNVQTRNKETYVPNSLTMIFSLIKIITYKFDRPRGYVNHMCTGKNSGIAIDVLTCLLLILDDNEVLIDKQIENSYNDLQEYIKLVLDNLDQTIHDNPNIMYDDIHDNDKTNCNMLDQIFALMVELSEHFSTVEKEKD